MQALERRNPQADFSKVVTLTVAELRRSPDLLFATTSSNVSPAVYREAREVRDSLKSFQLEGVERAVLKLAFLWHEDIADLFPHLVAETLARAAVGAPLLVKDITMRAETVAKALGSPCVGVDLLCSRFNRGMAPIHVDYGEFLTPGRPELSPTHVRALSFVMPYVGKGTEYLKHSRELAQGELSGAIQRGSNSIVGINRELEEVPEVAQSSWVSTAERTFSLHRNGLSIHRSPSSSDFRLVLALDACVAPERAAAPLDAIREMVIRNIRVIQGHRSKLR